MIGPGRRCSANFVTWIATELKWRKPSTIACFNYSFQSKISPFSFLFYLSLSFDAFYHVGYQINFLSVCYLWSRYFFHGITICMAFKFCLK